MQKEHEIKDLLQQAIEELKRADHLIYVSLKYTRTVDVIRSIINRLVNSFERSVNALLVYAEHNRMIQSIPSNPVQQAESAKACFKDNKEIIDCIELYLFLRKLNRVKEYSAKEEYRKHVRMLTTLDGKDLLIDVPVVHEYYESAKKFIKLIGVLIEGEEE